ncbi:hypothetical protein CABS01_13494 [Colletotrichum abscissum]|uniref:Uncharacterized protein n=1 Tax=Colletotrichum abscissum TaxID=1671311 RepID=A0A9P9XE55_9PEZI|nr:uncharacterized protein CABS01_13494 [Colletotrichum abscissum]KAI3550434.1 hypothetical protein CABS02_07655 [Colletotrichum abscissum]KAK1485800.1 hypothetical protein CABS01_13494 [Colletotrichum abscissum]
MRFQPAAAFAILAVTTGIAAPLSSSKASIDQVDVDIQERRIEGQYQFNFANTFRGARHPVSGVILSMVYRAGSLFVTMHNTLTQDISAYIEEITQGGDIMAVAVEAGKTVEWTLKQGTDFLLGDRGKFSWKTNY